MFRTLRWNKGSCAGRPIRIVRLSSVRLRALALVSPTTSAASASVRSGRRIAFRTPATCLVLSGGGAEAEEGVEDEADAAASPSTTSAWPSWNLDSKAIRTAVRTAFLGIE